MIEVVKMTDRDCKRGRHVPNTTWNHRGPCHGRVDHKWVIAHSCNVVGMVLGGWKPIDNPSAHMRRMF